MIRKISTAFLCAFALAFAGTVAHGAIIFDDFNTDEGHFNRAPTFSGSSMNIAATSTADRVTTDSFEGAGNEAIVLDATTAGDASRLRFVSGDATPANNISFSTTAGEDGWIGFALKTDSPGWTAQLWIEGAANNGSVPKSVIADGDWHIYEWNLDDDSGGPDGWGPVAGIADGDADVEIGSYTIDSIFLRNPAAPATATFNLDFVAKSDSGSIAGLLIPEPTSAVLVLIGLVHVAAVRRRTS